MDYYVRAFCAAEQVPSIAQLIEWLKARDVHLTIQQPNGSVDLQSPNWREVALVYKPGRQPIVAKCHRLDECGKGAANEEIRSFLERIGRPGRSAVKRRVSDHLQATRYIIALRLPAHDMDDDGYDANGQILTYFSEFCDALIQADKEGFYEGDRLILEMK